MASNEQALSRIQDSTIILPVGSISGIASSILTECKIRDIAGYGLLGRDHQCPGSKGVGSAIEVLKKMYDLDLDVQPLIRQAEEIESTMQKLAEQVKTAETMPKRASLHVRVIQMKCFALTGSAHR